MCRGGGTLHDLRCLVFDHSGVHDVPAAKHVVHVALHAFAECFVAMKTRYCINADPGQSRKTRNVSHDIEEAQKTQVKVALAQEKHFLDWSS